MVAVQCGEDSGWASVKKPIKGVITGTKAGNKGGCGGIPFVLNLCRLMAKLVQNEAEQ